MTDASPLSPQSASAPAEITAKRDEYSSVMTTEYEATADQRVLGIGNCVPLVFCRYQNDHGGAWVTPPAGRYGAVINPRDGDSFAFGLVISDGQIGHIDIADVYKGPLQLNVLHDSAAVFAYDSMPSSGFDYQLQNLTPGAVIPGSPGSPGTPGTPDRWETTTHRDTRCFNVGGNTGTSFSIGGLVRAVITVRFTAGISGHYQIKVAGSTKKSGTYYPSAGDSPTVTWSDSFSEATLSVQVDDNASSPPGANRICVDLEYDTRQFIPGTPGTPAIPPTPDITLPDVVSTLPLYPGAGGDYQGMSCLAVKGRYGVDKTNTNYKHQVRCFVRSGLAVKRLVDKDVAASNMFPDLAFYLLDKAIKSETSLIDEPSFVRAAQFNAANNLFFNGVLANSVNLRDYLNRVSGFFMLGFVQQEGKFMLKPLLPITDNNLLSQGSVPIKSAFTADNIVLGSYKRSYVDKSKRAPFCALMTWRAQHEALFGVNKSTEVRYAGTAEDGPYEQYDMQEFCTTQAHAVLIGKYILAQRKHATHVINFQATSAVADLGPLDLISVAWGAETSRGALPTASEVYQVDAVTQGPDGTVSIEATHFPVNVNMQSLVALDVASNQFTIK